VILLHESEMLHEPVDRSRQIVIAYMRQNGVDRHGTVFHINWIVAEIGYRVYVTLRRKTTHR